MAIICLGYGVARSSLHKGEWASVLILSVFYFGASILDQVKRKALNFDFDFIFLLVRGGGGGRWEIWVHD